MRDTITFKDTITVEAFCKLRNSVGFQELTAAQAKTVLSNTSFLVTAVHGDIHIGLVRVLTDMVTDAYITDVIVHPDFQNQGLGQKLVEHALEQLKTISTCNVRLACSLYANAGKEPFYEKFGFQRLPNTTYGHGMLLEI